MTATVRRAAVLMPLALLALATAACDSLGPDFSATMREQLAQGQHAWEQQAPARYTMVVTRASGGMAPVTARLVISGDQIESAVHVATNEPLEAELLAQFRTVDGLFAKIRHAIDTRAPGLYVRYDAEFGFPVELAIDYDRTSLSSNVTIAIAEFQPLD